MIPLFKNAVESKRVREELEKIYLEISKSASLPGYRTGKAPLDLIRQRFKKEAHEEVMKSLMSDSFNSAMKESGIRILGTPAISDLEFEEEKGMSYKAKVALIGCGPASISCATFLARMMTQIEGVMSSLYIPKTPRGGIPRGEGNYNINRM